MEKILGQAQIDSLFAQVPADGGEAAKKRHGDQPEAYNFSRAGQISNEQMRAISTVNDLFARNLMHTMGAWLRTEFQVNLVSGEQMTFIEFVERIPEMTYLCSVRLEPLGAVGLIELELTLAAPIVDLLLGGTGRAMQLRSLTDIEELIMASVLEIFIKELNAAWQPVGLIFKMEKRESSTQVSRLMPAGEKSLCVCFELKMPGALGGLNICLPSVVLNTILRKVIADRDKPRRRSPEIRQRVFELTGQARVGAVLQFAPVRMSSTEILNLRLGSVLRLPIPQHASAEIRVGGLRLGEARPVRSGEHRGARLELALDATPLLSASSGQAEGGF